jgi:hypothetical protein
MKEMRFWSIKLHNGYLFCVLLILNLAILCFYRYYVFDYDLFYNLYKDQMDFSRIGFQAESMKRWFDLNYILLPPTMLFRFAFVTFILQFPLLFYLDHIPFARVFRIVMIASVALSAGAMIQGYLLVSLPKEMITAERLNQMPLSVAGLMPSTCAVTPSTFMILNQFNIFELIWCLIIYHKFKTQMLLSSVDIILLISGAWLFLLILQWIFIEIVVLLGTG